MIVMKTKIEWKKKSTEITDPCIKSFCNVNSSANDPANWSNVAAWAAVTLPLPLPPAVVVLFV